VPSRRQGFSIAYDPREHRFVNTNSSAPSSSAKSTRSAPKWTDFDSYVHRCHAAAHSCSSPATRSASSPPARNASRRTALLGRGNEEAHRQQRWNHLERLCSSSASSQDDRRPLLPQLRRRLRTRPPAGHTKQIGNDREKRLPIGSRFFLRGSIFLPVRKRSSRIATTALRSATHLQIRILTNSDFSLPAVHAVPARVRAAHGKRFVAARVV